MPTNQPDIYTMFLKLFEPIFAALEKNFKIGLIAILIVVAIMLGINGENRVKKTQEDCAEERKDMREENSVLRDQIRQSQQRYEDYVFRQLESKTHSNDSTLREKTKGDINKVMP